MIKKLISLFPIYKYKISGHSMEPTLKEGDSVLASTLPYLFSKPKTGDIIALNDPITKKILIKRITEIKNNKYFVLGDNKSESSDSRSFGWVTKKDIIGKIIYQGKSEARNPKSETISKF